MLCLLTALLYIRANLSIWKCNGSVVECMIESRQIQASLASLPCVLEQSKGAKIRNQYNKLPHLTQDTNGKVTNSQLKTTNESQEVSPFPAGDHKAQINRRAQRHNKHNTEKTRLS